VLFIAIPSLNSMADLLDKLAEEFGRSPEASLLGNSVIEIGEC
jgi:hypothetical protein